MNRWTFKDLTTLDTYVMEHSPSEMTSINLPHQTTPIPASPVDGRIFAWRTPDTGVDWTFSGVVYSQAAHDSLVDWFQRSSKIEITDHYGRKITCRFVSLDLTPYKVTSRFPYKHKYTIKAFIYSWGRIDSRSLTEATTTTATLTP